MFKEYQHAEEGKRANELLAYLRKYFFITLISMLTK